jgi:asparagine synthase (glutamine-hydrolysing)
MCGIAGLFDLTAPRPVDEGALRRMTTALRHRGPDGDGFHTEPGLGLGHRRLAIIDVAGGQQPMFNEDLSVAIVFNGEIYNFTPLRQELEARGHVFRSRCDTETIIHAWEEWGEDCLARITGMFAFAIWDRNRGTLFLARDRMGKKPLYYTLLPDGVFAFASELCALTALPGFARNIRAAAVEDFFALGAIPDPGTIYEGVFRLPAAHALTLTRGATVPLPRRFWRIALAPRADREADAIAELTARLTGCVAERMIADVPLGAFLSGGVDSSAVVALAAGLHSGPLATCTIGFGGPSDETQYAAMVAQRYGTEHRAEPSAIDYIDAARDQALIFGEPFGDTSSQPTFNVCAVARKAVTVALSGDGGDETLAGYRRYRWHAIVEAARAYLPAPVRRRLIGKLAAIYPKLDHAPRWLRAKYTLTELSLDSALGYYRTLVKIHAEQRHSLFTPALRAAIDGHDAHAPIATLMHEADDADPVTQAQYVDINSYLVDDILVKVDRASMANALEVRAPLLDDDFAQWAINLPRALKLRGREGKYVFKRAMEPYLPREILYRPKQGFAEPLATQFRVGAERLRDRLIAPVMRDCGLFNTRRILRLIDEHSDGLHDHSMSLWLLLVFEGFLTMQSVPAEHAIMAQAES